MPELLPPWAADYVGIPYRTDGRDRSGVDCWGLCALIWRERFGRELPLYEAERWRPGADPDTVGTGAVSYASRFVRVRRGDEALGDGVLLRMRGHPLHVGLVLAPGWMIHAAEGADSCIEDYERFMWSKRVIGFYRYAEA